jgi:hypothetical protein
MTTALRPNSTEIVERDATCLDIREVATYLQDHVGQRATAYVSGLKDSKVVGQWARGKVKPRDQAALRLRSGYLAVRLLVDAFGDDTAKAWLFGTNRQLDDQAPAMVLRHTGLPEEIVPVVQAARSFAESGRRAPAAEAEPNLGTRLRALERSHRQLEEQVHELLLQLSPRSRGANP